MNINKKNLLISILIASATIIGCINDKGKVSTIEIDNHELHQEADNMQKVKRNFILNDFFSDDKDLDLMVDSILGSLTIPQRISQVIMTSLGKSAKKDSGTGRSKEESIRLIQNGIVGGLIISTNEYNVTKYNILEYKIENYLAANVPLFFAIDGEPNFINKRLKSKILNDKLSITSNIFRNRQAKDAAEKINAALLDVGFNYNFAPVCDINLNQEIISDRSFSSEIDEVKALANEFATTTQAGNIIATAKHFPGHGNVIGDSHKELVHIDGKLAEIESFSYLIENDILSVMVGHIEVKSNDKYNTRGLPSSLSKLIVDTLLRQQLGFEGIVITDAMCMGAVADIPEADILAIKAGCDIVLRPKSEENLFQEMISAYKSDIECKTKINESVRRIIRAKVCLGLYAVPTFNKVLSSETKVILKGKMIPINSKKKELAIQMELSIDEDIEINGSYFYNNKKDLTLDLRGYVKSNVLVLNEYYEGNQKAGFRFICKDDKKLSGIWTDSKNRYIVSLEIVREI